MFSPREVGRCLPLALALVLCALPLGCRTQPLLYDVSVEPALITPNQDGDSDVALISYRVSAPALVTIALVGQDGERHVLRDARPRTPDAYAARFGGIVDGRMLRDGEYEVIVTASPESGASSESVSVSMPLALSGGDSDPPELGGFAVQPTEFTPNQDGIGDRVAISYRLDEATDVRLWLETAAGEYVTDILEETRSADYPGEPGPHVYDFDAGVDANAPPPPDGDYFVVGQAVDQAGNVTVQRLPLTIKDGGQPKVALLGDVRWSATLLPLGTTLTFTVAVANVGGTPVRTRGPEPGFIYDNQSTFNQPAPPELILLARSGDRGAATHLPVPQAAQSIDGVVLDLAQPDRASGAMAGSLSGRPPKSQGAAQEPSPAAAYGEAAPLARPAGLAGPSGPVESDEERTVPSLCGHVMDAGAPVGEASVYAFEPDGDNGIRAQTDQAGRFCFAGLSIPPLRERTFARSPGAIRLGLEYDERRTDLGYPYRWQLGSTSELHVCQAGGTYYLCLMPGQTVTITGGVRFVEPPFRRRTRVYLALMHEDVRRIQGPYGLQQITIEY